MAYDERSDLLAQAIESLKKADELKTFQPMMVELARAQVLATLQLVKEIKELQDILLLRRP